MLATRKININNNSLLPSEINKIIESYTEITFTIICEKIRQYSEKIKVSLINVFTNDTLEEIYLDDVNNETVKLSSDGTKLIYLDIYSNMVYYDIHTKNIKKILIGLCPLYYYFDRNGLYFITSNNNTTYIFDIIGNKLLYELPIHSIINDNIEMISEDYKRILCLSKNNIYIYDLINGNKIYSSSLELNQNYKFFSYTNKTMKYIIYGYDNIINILNIDGDRDTHFYYKDDEEDEDINYIKGIAFYKDLVAIHYNYYVKIINIKQNKIERIEDTSYCVLCNRMEFTKDGKYLIIKKDDIIIETILTKI